MRIFLLATILLVSSCEDIILEKDLVPTTSSGATALANGWHTQLGAVTNAGGSNAGDDKCQGVSVDTSGNVYCAGFTWGGMSEASGGNNDAFVMKLDSSGNILWHTQLGAVTNAGGSNAGYDACAGVSVDTSGNVYCAGYTSDALGEAHGGGSNDAFVMKLDSSGNILWLTQLGAVTNAGGSNAGNELCQGVSVDSSGNVYCAGYTTNGMSEASGGSNDAFVMKLDSSGNILWHTQLGAVTNAGGSNAGDDKCLGVSVDTSGNVYCAGFTSGGMSEASGGGGADAFVMKLDSSGNILWHTQLGTVTNAGGSNAGYDACDGVSVDTSGNVYCAGVTTGDMSEVKDGFVDVFVMKLDSSGNILWLTQLGATTTAPGGSNAGDDYCQGVSVDSSGNVYCAGYTNGGMSEAGGGNNDAFILKLDSNGNIDRLTQFGTTTIATGGDNSGDDTCASVAVDASGNSYCGGYTTGGMGEANGGSNDAYILKLNDNGEPF